MIYKMIIDYLVLYITPLKTPCVEISRVFFKPTLRIFISPKIIAGVFGLPPLLIMVVPLLLALWPRTCPLVILRLWVGIKRPLAEGALLPAAVPPPIFSCHAPLSAVIQNDVLENYGEIDPEGTNLMNQTHYIYTH